MYYCENSRSSQWIIIQPPEYSENHAVTELLRIVEYYSIIVENNSQIGVDLCVTKD